MYPVLWLSLSLSEYINGCDGGTSQDLCYLLFSVLIITVLLFPIEHQGGYTVKPQSIISDETVDNEL
jgi:hypothetical protein